MSGDQPQYPDAGAQEDPKVAADPAPTGQGQELPTNQEDVSIQPPNIADFLSSDEMQAIDEVSQRYADTIAPAALSSEPVLHDMGMTPPPPPPAPSEGMPGGEPLTQQAAPQQPLQQHVAPQPLGQAVVPQHQPGNEGVPGGDTHGTPVAPPPEPVEHHPGGEAPLGMTPPRTATRDLLQANNTGVSPPDGTTPPGSATIDNISDNDPWVAAPQVGQEPPQSGHTSNTTPTSIPSDNLDPGIRPPVTDPFGLSRYLPADRITYDPTSNTTPTQVDQSASDPDEPPPEPIFVTNRPLPSDFWNPTPTAAALAAHKASEAAIHAAEAASSAAAAKLAAEVDLDAGDEAIRAHEAAARAAEAAERAASEAQFASNNEIASIENEIARIEAVTAAKEAFDATEEAAW